ncbi:hypothetical protein ACUOA5_43990, partial [Escherichia coli]
GWLFDLGKSAHQPELPWMMLGIIGIWMGMFADWAVRAVLFYWRMVTGRWLWKYPRSEPQKCEKKPAVSE